MPRLGLVFSSALSHTVDVDTLYSILSVGALPLRYSSLSMSYSIIGAAGRAGIVITASLDLNALASAAYHTLSVLDVLSGFKSTRLPLPLTGASKPVIVYIILDVNACVVFSVL